MKFANVNKSPIFFLILLAVIGGIVYLPLACQMGLAKDDWYLIYDAHSQGAQFFHEVYKIDRPARAYVMQLAYDLFGDRVVYYHLSGYLFRLLATYALFWSLNMIWLKYRKNNFLVALLLLIYPGFLSQPNPIDYQSQILSLCLAFASIAFTVKAIKTRNPSSKFLWIVLSILTGFFYPALVEYMLGLEVLRLCLIAQIVLQEKKGTFKEYALQTVKLWLPFISAPLIFLIWRVFFFESERRATDVASQFGQLFSSPLTGLWWLVNWIQDLVRVTLLAWMVPFNNLVLTLRLKEFLVGSGLGILVLLLVAAALVETRKLKLDEFDDVLSPGWKTSILITGIVTAFLALAPVIFVNRHADFGEYSRYTLASAVGAAMVLVVFVLTIRVESLRFIFLGLIILMAAVTHYANAVNYVQAAEQAKNFWWQVAWRAPNIQPGTTLIASYPVGGIQEDYFVWGPANTIYYPQKQGTVPNQIKLPAAVLTDDTVLQILIGRGEELTSRRGNEFTRDLSNILVMARATENSCVRFIDGISPDLSVLDPQRIILIAPKSKLENVVVDGDDPVPPADIFGDEPVHDWCFYYQKADLARQRGDWQEVARLAKEVEKLDLRPNDQIEWMPFLQAYALMDDEKQVKAISTRINKEPFYRQQACEKLNFMGENGYPLSPDLLEYVNELFCK
jgi:hypothetical protein